MVDLVAALPLLMPETLTPETFRHALRRLGRRDADLARIVRELGPPPMWDRPPGFPTLLYIILEQQVSLASARAAYNRLRKQVKPLTPAAFLELGDPTLKQIGFSRQKRIYGRHLAQAILDGSFHPKKLRKMNDDAVRAELIRLKGIGSWTADIYLLMVLRRPDIWPAGDLALAVAVHEVKRLDSRPTPDVLAAIGEAWRPWRAVAARILWHYYLNHPSR